MRLLPLKTNQALKSPQVMEFVRAANIDGASIVVIVDDEGDANKELARWVSEGLIRRIFDISELDDEAKLPIGGLLWKRRLDNGNTEASVFEDANFTVDELIRAWEKVKKPDITPEDFAKKVVKVQLKLAVDPTITCVGAILETAKKGISKPNLARALAEDCNDFNKPIIKLISKILRLANVSHTASYWRLSEPTLID